MKILSILRKSLKAYLWVASIFLFMFILWAFAGVPLFIDRLCIFTQAPEDADFIVCIGAGLTTGNLPTDDGWGRIYTSVQLYIDGYAPKIIFTGGGSGTVSEAEVYAECARWLGMDAESALLDPGPNQTSEHPRNIRAIFGAGIMPATRLDIVTSQLHSRRTALCFKKAGYTDFRLVTRYQATGRRTALRPVPAENPGEPPVTREVVVSRPNPEPYLRAEKKSSLPEFRQSYKSYKDIFIRLRTRSWHLFSTLRELGAMAVYKLKGYI